MDLKNLLSHFCYEDIFKNNKNLDGSYNWKNISQIKNLHLGFIDKYFFQIYLYRNLEKSGNLPYFIINKYGNYLNWNILLKNQQIPEDLLIKFKNKINFNICCKYQKLSLNFLMQFKDKINLSILKKNNLILPEIISDFEHYFVN